MFECLGLWLSEPLVVTKDIPAAITTTRLEEFREIIVPRHTMTTTTTTSTTRNERQKKTFKASLKKCSGKKMQKKV